MNMRYLFIWSITFSIFSSGHPVVASYGWGCRLATREQPPNVGTYEQMLADDLAIYIGDTENKLIYLTFDNGYEQGYTGDILTILRKHNVPATFFVTGHYVKTAPDLVKRMVDEGHIVGNHSYHHPDFTTMTKTDIAKELTLVETAVRKLTDQKEMIYMRPPRGTFNEQTLRWVNELGYVHIFWSLAFKDWETNKQRGWQYAYDQIMQQIHPGAILLLHTVSADNANALEKVIIELKRRGYTFKSLDDLVIPHVIEGML